MRPPIPANEDARLAALQAHAILDSPPERAFDDIAQLAKVICATPMALVSLVDRDRQWFKARVGLDATETPRDHAFCAHAIVHRDALVVPDTHLDGRFADNPLVTGDPKIRFYAGVPLFVEGGAAVGTLCVIDRVPRALSPEQLAALTALARRVEVEMRLRGAALSARRAETERSRRTEPHAPATRATTLAEGTLVSARYRIEKVIGEGGMGTVYLAVDSQASERKLVALKVMRSAVASDHESVERFAREARALLSLESQHVARCLDAGNLDGGAPYLVIEYLEGRDLAQLASQRVDLRGAVELVAQACEGVASAHEAGVVHRDLKPSNLFLVRGQDGEPLVKLLDFGLSKANDDDVSAGSDPLTEIAAVFGTPRYMSPEQMLSSHDVEEATDIWALGVILYELVTREHPFDGSSATELCANIFMKEPYPMRTRPGCADVPEALDSVVLRCLAQDTAKRWPSVRALAAALAPFRRSA